MPDWNRDDHDEDRDRYGALSPGQRPVRDDGDNTGRAFRDDRNYDAYRRAREERLRADFERWRDERGGRAGPYRRSRSGATGLDLFDRSIQTAHIWLDEIMDEIGPDRHIAWHVLGAVLRTIRDRVPVPLAAHLGAQLPLIVRGLYYDQFQPAHGPERTRNFDDFLDSVADHMRGIGRPVDPRDAAHAVFRTLGRHISDGQIRKIQDALPRDVRRSWEAACEDVDSPEERAAGMRGGWAR